MSIQSKLPIAKLTGFFFYQILMIRIYLHLLLLRITDITVQIFRVHLSTSNLNTMRKYLNRIFNKLSLNLSLSKLQSQF